MRRLADRRGVDLDVYAPAEDSYLLLAVVRSAVEPDDVVVDVGTGSGFLARRIHDELGASAVGVDINPHACRRAMAAGVQTVRGSLVSAIQANACDVVLCNPPYLPTVSARTGHEWFDRALDGGPTGREFIEALLPDLQRVLRPGGRAFVVVSSKMGFDAVRSMAELEGYRVSRVREDAYPDETLAVLKLVAVDS